MPQKRYLKLDISAIYGWAFSNNVCRVRKSANKLAETRKHVSGNPLRNDKENDSYSIPNNRLCDPPPPKPIPKKSPSLKKHEAVSFDPFSYKLKDGSPLQEITAKSFAKKMKDPKQAFLILSNVEWYEKQVEKGIKPKSSHERFLQFAISNDLASKENIIANNDLYAQFVKDEHKLNGIKILKTLVQLDKKNGSKPESISKNLPEITFSNIIDNYVKHMKLKE
jgi:hypothetical protein